MPGTSRSRVVHGGSGPTPNIDLLSPGRRDDRLRESERRFLAFLDVNFDVLYDWDIASGTIAFSDQLSALLRLPEGKEVRTFTEWLERIHPEDRTGAVANLRQSLGESARYRDEYRLRREDGGYVLVTDQGLILPGPDGTPAHMVGAMRDVTREREAQRALGESEELYQTLFRRAANPAFHVDAQGHYLDLNQAALDFFECTKDQVVGRSIGDHFPPEMRRVFATGAVAEEEWGGQAGLEVDVAVGSAAKTLILTVVPCSVGGRRTLFFLGADITAQKRIRRELERSEETLRTQAKILEERNTALRVFLEQREQDRLELEERIRATIERLIHPTLSRLERLLGTRPESAQLAALRINLDEIVRPYARRLTSLGSGTAPLTRRELEIANLIRLGKTTDEIAQALRVSRSVVSFHRGNIRRKLGMAPGGPRLTTYMAGLAEE
jgi:PAS domain S-box-containing protein